MRVISPSSVKRHAAVWLRKGITPQKMALTLALGFAVGCIPVIGIPTVLCAGLALALKLNLPAIQAANYAAMPLQLFLIVPFVRLGRWLFAPRASHAFTAGFMHRLSGVSLPGNLIAHIGSMALQAIGAWLIVAGPAVLLLTLMLTVMLRRIPALGMVESGD
jgi:uncharacterized protein (DUF2062 family)